MSTLLPNLAGTPFTILGMVALLNPQLGFFGNFDELCVTLVVSCGQHTKGVWFDTPHIEDLRKLRVVWFVLSLIKESKGGQLYIFIHFPSFLSGVVHVSPSGTIFFTLHLVNSINKTYLVTKLIANLKIIQH